jgi:hypothetical protein
MSIYNEIQGNPRLVSLNGLGSLTYVLELQIIGNPLLRDLRGLERLLTTSESVYIDSNDSLEDLDGLETLTIIGGGLYITNNPRLDSLKGLSSLESIEPVSEPYPGNLQIYNNDSLPLCEAEWLANQLEHTCDCPLYLPPQAPNSLLSPMPRPACYCKWDSVCDCNNNGTGTCE